MPQIAYFNELNMVVTAEICVVELLCGCTPKINEESDSSKQITALFVSQCMSLWEVHDAKVFTTAELPFSLAKAVCTPLDFITTPSPNCSADVFLKLGADEAATNVVSVRNNFTDSLYIRLEAGCRWLFLLTAGAPRVN